MRKSRKIILLIISASSLWSMPEQKEVAAGRADFSSSHAGHLRVETSDKAIINYHKFNILENESVTFVQPSSKSCCLNRVVGKDPSKILGHLQANGRFFLVNPQGIYFGKNATVNTGSLIASTLNILDEDFLNEKYCFFQESGNQNASITNEGSIFAEGSIALFSPLINNKGSLIAHADKVVLASAEKVVLDFTGDGLIRFSVEGELKNALIENYGEIQAANGSVELSLKAAEKAIKTVVNTDGITPASALEEIDGVIRLVDGSLITSKEVHLNGEELQISGKIDVSGEKGGRVILEGADISLQKSKIDASGLFGGGEVFIGGSYQGKGPLRNSLSTSMDAESCIFADAKTEGDGGRVILWSDGNTLFNGKIYTRGGEKGGNGGFVETSGRKNLGCMTGWVNSLSPAGKPGDWLLDPSTLDIVSGSSGSLPLNCGDTSSPTTIGTTQINGAASNVILCGETITQESNAPINITTGGVTLTFQGNDLSASVSLGANIQTNNAAIIFSTFANLSVITNPVTITSGGGAVSFNNNVFVQLQKNLTINTSGGAVSFTGQVQSQGTNSSLNINAGAGVVTFSDIVGGSSTSAALSSLTVSGSTITPSNTVKTIGAISFTAPTAINLNQNLTTTGGSVTFTGPVVLGTTLVVDTTNNGSYGAGNNITFSGSTSTINGAFALTLKDATGASSSTITLGGAVGGTTALTNLTFTSPAGTIQIGGNIRVTGANPLNFPTPVNVIGTSVINSTSNLTTTFSSTINGANQLTLTCGTGGATLTGAVGGTTPLASLTATAATINQNSTVATTGAISYTAPTAINLGGNLTTSAGSVAFTGPVTLSTAVQVDTTNSAPAGNSITFTGSTSTINGTFALTLLGGTGAFTTTFGGAVGATTPLASLVVSAATITQSSTVKTTGGISYAAPTATNLGGNLTTAAGTVTFTGPVVLGNNILVDTTNGVGPAGSGNSIAFSGSTSTVNGAFNLLLDSGSTNTITLGGAVGGTTALAGLGFSSSTGTIQIGSNIRLTGASSLNFPAAVSVNGTSLINSTGSSFPISFSSTVNGANALTLTCGTGGATLTGAVGGGTPLASLTVSAATITQSSTVKTTGLISYNGSTVINLGGSLTTAAGSVSFTGPVVLGTTLQVDTTNGTLSPAGNSITFSGSTSTINGAFALTLNGGTGAFITTLGGIVGGTAPLASLTVTAATITQSSTVKTTGAISYTAPTAINLTGNLTTAAGTVTFTGPVVLGTTLTVDTTNAGGSAGGNNIAFSGSTSTINGAFALTLNSGTTGTNTITLGGAVGGTTALTNLTFTSSAGTIQIGSNIRVTGANSLIFPAAVALTGTSLITSTSNLTTTFSSTINGANALTLTCGTGTATLTGAVGGTTPLASLTATAATITQSSTVKTTGAISYTAPTAINLGGNLTTAAGTVTFTGPVVLGTTLTVDTTNAGGSAGGNNIAFSGSTSTINGAFALTLNSGTTGTNTITLGGAIGGTTALTNLTFTSSAGTIQIGSNIRVTGANSLIFPAAVALTGTSLITSTSNLTTTFSSTINGANALTLTCGTGTATLTGAVGGTTPLASLTATAATITQSNIVKTTGAISYTAPTAINLGGNLTTAAASVACTGPVTLNNTVQVDTTNNGGSPAGNSITFSGSTSTINGAFALTLNGGTGAFITTLGGAVGGITPLASLTATAATITQSSTVKTTGAISYTAPTAINLGGNLTTAAGSVACTGPVTLTATVQADTTNGGLSPAGNNITFTGSTSTIDGAFALTLNGGTGAFITTFGGAVGGATPLTGLTATAATITQSSTVKTTGAISYTAPTAINLGGNLTTAAGTVTFTGPVALNATLQVDTTNAGGSAGGNNIAFSGSTSTINGAFALTLNSGTTGTNTITLGGAVGGTTALTNLTFTSSAGTIQIGSNIRVTGANSLIFPAAVALTGTSLITSTSNLTINFNSTINGANALTLTCGTGTAILTGAVGGTTPLASLTATAATITQSSTVKTTGAISYTAPTAINLGGNLTTSAGSVACTGPVTLNNIVQVDTTNGGGSPAGNSITFSGSTSTIDGAFVLTLNGGTGAFITTFGGAVGGVVPLTSLTVTAATITQSSTAKTTGAISYTAPTAINLGGSLTTAAGIVTFTGPVTLGATLQVDTTNSGGSPAGNNITFSGSTSTINGAFALTLNGGTGAFITTLGGAVGGATPLTSLTATAATITQSSTVKTTGAISYTAPTAINLGGNLTTAAGSVACTGPVILTATVQADTTNGGLSPAGNNITFSGSTSTINGAFALTLNGGTGAFITTLGGAVGGATPLTSLTASAATITQSSTAKTTGAISYTAPTAINLGGSLTTAAGIVTFTGPVTLGATLQVDTTNSGGSPAGNNITFSGSTSTINGAFALTLKDGTGVSNAITLSGAVGATAALTNLTFTSSTGTIQIGSNITVTGANPLNFPAAVALTGTSIITSTSNLTTTFSSTINGANALTLTCGTGTATLTGAVGGITPLASLTATAATITQSSTVKTTGAISYTAPTAINLGGSLTTSAGSVACTGPVTLGTTLQVDTTNSGGSPAGNNITFTGSTSTINGAFALTLNGGTGAFITTLGGAVGGATPLTGLTATAATITQSSTVKTTGAISYTAPTAINLGGNLTTAAGSVACTGPVILTATVQADTTNGGLSPAGNNITFSGSTSTINGAFALTLNGGTGAFITTLGGAVGGATPLTSLTASAATITQSSTVKTTGAISYTAPTAINLGGNLTTAAGSVTCTGPVILTATVQADTTNGGLSPAGNNITFSGSTSTINGAFALTLNGGTGAFITTLGGAVGGATPLTSLTASAATITQSSTAKTTGAISYTAPTAINLGGSLTTAAGIVTFTGPVTLGATLQVDTTNSGGSPAGNNITFSGSTSTINGAFALTLNGGTGAFITTLGGAVGGATPLTSLTATAATITQSSTVKTTGAISYTAPTAINLGGNLTTAAGSVACTGPVILTATVQADTTNGGLSPAGNNITFSGSTSTINGAFALTLNGGTGAFITTLGGAVGGATPLTSLTASAATITQSSTVKTTGAISYTAPTAINLGGNLTTAAGSVTCTGPITLGTTLQVDTTNSGGSPAGNNITFSGSTSTINGAFALTLNGGTGAFITTLGGAVGGATPLTSLTASAATITQSSTAKTTGAISYTAPTAINLGGSLTTAAGIVTFTGPVTLGATLQVDTTNSGGSPAGNNITFSGSTSTINGAFALTLKDGTGVSNAITLSGAVGATAALTNLTFTSSTGTIQIGSNITVTGANPLNFPAAVALAGTSIITSTSNLTTTFNSTIDGANALTLTCGTGTATLTGAVGATTPLASLTISAATIVQDSTVKTSTTIPGLVSYTGSTLINLFGNITTAGGTITMNGPTQVNGASTFTLDSTNANATPAGATISFPGTLNGAVSATTPLVLRSGTTGNVTFTGAVGGVHPLVSITIPQANNVTTAGTAPMAVGFLTQSAGSGTTTFNGTVNTTTASGVNLTGTNFAVNANVTTANGSNGPVSISHSGTLTIAGGVIISADGGFTDTGSGSTNLAGTINTNGFDISLLRPITLTGSTILNTGTLLQVGDIIFSNTVNGTQSLDLTAGGGNITFTGIAGGISRLGAVTVHTTNNFTANAMTLTSMSQAAGTGTTTFNGALDFSGVAGLVLTTKNVSLNNTLNTANLGPATFTVSGTLVLSTSAICTVDGPFTQNQSGGTGSVQLAGSITETHNTPNNITFNGPVTLMAITSLDTSTGGGNINCNNTLDGPFALFLTTGGGSITCTNAVGGISRLGALSIACNGTISTQAVTAASIALTGTSSSTFNGAINTNGSLGINLAGAAISFLDNITTTGTGPITIANTGLFTTTAGKTITSNGAFLQNGAGNVSLAGNVTTTNATPALASITFGSNVSSGITLTASAKLDSSTGNGAISLHTVDGAFSFDMTSGTGTISTSASGNIGSTARLGAITIQTAGNVTLQAVTASSISQLAGSGLTHFIGALNTNGASGISLTGSAFTLDGTFTTTGAGNVTIHNSGTLTFNAGANGSNLLAFSQTGAGAVILSSSITSTGAMQFLGPLSAVGTGVLNTSSNALDFSNTVDGPGNLSLNTNTGNLTFHQATGGIARLGALTIVNNAAVSTQAITAASIALTGTSSSTFNAAINTNGASGISLTAATVSFLDNVTTTGTGPITITNSGLFTTTAGKTITSNGAFLQNGAGNVSLAGNVAASNATPALASITFDSALTLTAAASLDSSAGNGAISLNTVDGPFSLDLTLGTASTANLTIGGAIGGVSRVGALTLHSVYNAQVNNVTATSIAELQGSGTTTIGTPILTATINTNGAAGINLTGTNFVRYAAITTTNLGSLIVTVSGLITGVATNTTNIDGSYTQLGTAPFLYAAGSYITHHGSISFVSPLVLVGLTIFDTSLGTAGITLSQTVNGLAGTENLDLIAGGGDIHLNGAIGGTKNVNAVTIGSANNFTSLGIKANSLSMSNLAMLATFNGALNIAGPIALSGSQFLFNSSVTTTSGGSVTITNSGTLTLVNAGPFNLAGSFQQNGTGAVHLDASITTNNALISFASPITLMDATTLNSGGGDIDLAAVDGAFDLTLTAGAGNVNLNGAVGLLAPPTKLEVSSANNIHSFGSMAIAGPLTLASTGTTTFDGTISTTTADGISVNGNTINVNNTITTTNLGPIAITNSGTLTIPVGSTITSSSSFTQTSGGGGSAVSLGAPISTVGLLSFASPITLTNGVALNSGGNTITLSSTVNGGYDLTLTAGVGSIGLGAIGGTIPLIDVTVQSGNVTAAAITAASLTQNAGSGTYNGALSTSTLTGIHLTGSAFTLNNVTTTSSGPLVVINSGLLTLSGTTYSIAGACTQTSGGGSPSVSLSGAMTAGGAISFASPVSLSNTTSLDTSAANQNVTFSSTLNGAQALTLTAGSGSIQFDGTVGNTNPLSSLTATGANIVQMSTLQTVGAILETGAMSIGGNITTDRSNITLTGGNVTTTSTLTITTITSTPGVGNISITGTLNPNTSGKSLTLTTATGHATSVTLGNVIAGSVPFNNFAITSDSISWHDFGSAGAGATGTTTLTASNTITFLGTVYKASTQNYTGLGQLPTEGYFFNSGATTTISSGGNAITFNGSCSAPFPGQMELNAGTNLTIQSNGGAITIPWLIGPGQNLTLDAQNGTITYCQIGDVGHNLNIATFTSVPPVNPPVTGPVYATTIIINTGSITYQGTNIITSGVPISFSNSVVLTNDITLSTCPIGADITFNQSLNSDNILTPRKLTIDACGHDVYFIGPIGNTIPLAAIIILSARNVHVDNTADLGYFQQTGPGTGTTYFQSGLTATGADSFGYGLDLDTVTINLTGSIAASGGGMNLAHSGSLTIANGTSIAINGTNGFLQIGPGSVLVGGSITTTDQPIYFTSAVSLNGPLVLNSKNLTGGLITFHSTLDSPGANDVSMTAGNQNIILTGNVGATNSLGNLTIVSVQDLHAFGNMSASSITQSAGSGTTTFDGAVSTTNSSGINLTGSAFALNNNVSTINTGPLIVTNSGLLTLSGTTYSIAGACTQTSGGVSSSVSLAGSMTAGGAISFASPTSLSNPTSLDTSASGQNITFSSTLDGPGALSLNLGTLGSLNFGDVVGGSSVLGAILITNVKNATANAAVTTGSTLTQSNGSGTTAFNGALTTNGALSLTGSVFTFGAPFTTNNNSVTINNLGSLTFQAGAIGTALSTFSQTVGSATTTLPSSITATSTMQFQGPVVVPLLGLGSLTGGGITLNSTVNGPGSLSLTASGISNLTLAASCSLLNALTMSCSGTLSAQGISASSIALTGSSNSTFNGALNVNGSSGINLTAATISFLDNVTTTSNGPITITNSGLLTTTAGKTITSNGVFLQNGSGNVSLAGTVMTTNATASLASITFGSNVSSGITLTAAAKLDSSTGNGAISLNTVDGGFDFDMTSGTGAITVSGNIGSGARLGAITIQTAGNVTAQQAVTASSISQLAGSGLTHFIGALDTNGASGISLTGSAFTLDGTFTTHGAANVTIHNSGTLTFNAGANGSNLLAFSQTGAGAVILSSSITSTGAMQFLGPLSAVGTGVLNTSSNALDFSNTVDGPGNLSLNTNTGNLTFHQATGGIARLGALTIVNNAAVSTQAITAASIALTGTSSSTFNAAINTNGASGISLTAATVSFLDNVTTTGTGPITITNSGLFTTTAGKTITSNGAFLQNGAGNVSLAGNVAASNATPALASITFDSALTLTAAASLDSSAGNGAISLNTVDGPFSLDLTLGTASTANLTIGGAIGGVSRVGALTLHSVYNAQVNNVTATSIAELQGSGTTTIGTPILTATINTNGAAGINLTGTNFARYAAITTTNLGSLIVTVSGLITGVATNVTDIDGSYTQLGTAPFLYAAGAYTTHHGSISFVSPLILVGLTIFDTSLGTAGITLSQTVNGLAGTENLDLIAGLGDIHLNGAIGGNTTLNAVTIGSANNFTSLGIKANSLSMSNLATLATFNGALNIAGSIGLSGSQFLFNSNVTTTSGGTVTINNATLLTFNPAITFSVDGTFAQTGGGLNTLGGTISTNNQQISLASDTTLNGNLQLDSHGGNVLIDQEVNGPYSFTIDAGVGDVTINHPLALSQSMQNFSVTNAHDVNLNGVGSSSTTVLGAMSIQASHDININNTVYSANNQSYSAANQTNVNTGQIIQFTSYGTPIAFPTGATFLSANSDVRVQTNGGSFSYQQIIGTVGFTLEEVSINTGSGTALMNTMDPINNLIIVAGNIIILGPITVLNPNFQAIGSIENGTGVTPLIQATNNETFNALTGDVGSFSSPINVQTTGFVYGGAHFLATFSGISGDNTAHDLPSNVPCILIWNGTILHDCRVNPPPPVPPVVVTVSFPFAVPGFDSSSFNLASDFFFLPFFLDDTYIKKRVPMYSRQPLLSVKVKKVPKNLKPKFFLWKRKGHLKD